MAGVRMHLLDHGPREADEAIVLIHGASGNLRDFAFGFIDRLAAHPAGAGRRVIAIDRPGFGYSQRGGGGSHRPARQAAMMRAAVAQRGVKRAVLLGHSLGAVSALAWLLDAPETVSGLMALSGVSHPWPGSAGRAYDFLSAPLLGGVVAHLASAIVSEAKAKAEIGKIFAPQQEPQGYAEFVGVGLALRPKTIRANGCDIGRLKPLIRAQASRYGAIDAPVAIVHGAEDTIVPPSVHAIPLSRRCPNAELTLLPGVGHMPHHTVVEPVLDALSRIFKHIAERERRPFGVGSPE